MKLFLFSLTLSVLLPFSLSNSHTLYTFEASLKNEGLTKFSFWWIGRGERETRLLYCFCCDMCTFVLLLRYWHTHILWVLSHIDRIFLLHRSFSTVVSSTNDNVVAV